MSLDCNRDHFQNTSFKKNNLTMPRRGGKSKQSRFKRRKGYNKKKNPKSKARKQKKDSTAIFPILDQKIISDLASANKIQRSEKYVPDAFLEVLYCGSPPDAVSTESEPLLNPRLRFAADRLYDFDIEDEMSPVQVRSTKLLNYLTPILYQFYAYQQYIHKYDYAELIVIETKEKDKLRDLVPCAQTKTRMNLSHEKIVSMFYLSNAECIISYFQALGFDSEKGEIDDNLKLVKYIQDNNKMRGTHFPVVLCADGDGLACGQIIKRPNSCGNIKKNALAFEENIKWSCNNSHYDLLNIHLKEKYVYAVDIFAEANFGENEMLSNSNDIFEEKSMEVHQTDPDYVSNEFLYAYHHGKPADIVSRKYEPLLHPKLKFNKDVPLKLNDVESTGPSRMPPHKVRYMKLINYIGPINNINITMIILEWWLLKAERMINYEI